MAITFLLVFAFLFTPSFGGENAFHASDNLFNSIAKGSTYYIPDLQAKAREFRGTPIDGSLKLDGAEKEAQILLQFHEAAVVDLGGALDVEADLGEILLAVLADSDAMFHNRGEEVSGRYSVPEKQALFVWWQIMKALERSLQNQRRFTEAAFVTETATRGVEVAYNFYGVEPERVTSKIGILSFSLVFYVLYTLWWGYAIFYIAQGLGLQLRGGAKKEV
jgi:hypothetical protein